MSTKRINTFFSVVCFYFCALVACTGALEEAKFIDVDEFKFVKLGQTSGLRVCVFDVKAQQYESITYYVIPATHGRKTDGVLLENLHGLSITYDGDITIHSLLKGVITRTCGKFIGKQAHTSQWVDDQKRNIGLPLSRNVIEGF